jgi:molecular chaperone DnaK
MQKNESGSQTTVQENTSIIQDVTSHGFGIIALNENMEDENTIIVKRNTSIPAYGKQIFSLPRDNQQAIRLRLTEGDETDPRYVMLIGETLIKLKNMLPQYYPITVEIAVDNNGIVHVYAYEGAEEDGLPLAKLGEMEVKRKGNLSDEDVAEKARQLSSIRPN